MQMFLFIDTYVAQAERAAGGLLVESQREQPGRQEGDLLAMPGRLGVAHQDHVSNRNCILHWPQNVQNVEFIRLQGMFVFDKYEQEVAHQMSLVPQDDLAIQPIDEWIKLGVKKMFDKKN